MRLSVNNIILSSILSLIFVFQCGWKAVGVVGKSIVKEDKIISVRRSDGGNRFG